MKLDEMRIADNGDLLPCPHCGEQEHLYLAYRLDACGEPDRAPYCIDCIGCGHEFVPREGADVVAAWNRRADATGAEVLRLREAMEAITGVGFDAPMTWGGTDAEWERKRANIMQATARAALKGESP